MELCLWLKPAPNCLMEEQWAATHRCIGTLDMGTQTDLCSLLSLYPPPCTNCHWLTEQRKSRIPYSITRADPQEIWTSLEHHTLQQKVACTEATVCDAKHCYCNIHDGMPIAYRKNHTTGLRCKYHYMLGKKAYWKLATMCSCILQAWKLRFTFVTVNDSVTSGILFKIQSNLFKRSP